VPGHERLDLSGGFNYVRANAPPGGSERFFANGFYGASGLRILSRVWLEGEYARAHGNNISPLGQNLTLNTFAAGPRVGFTLGRLHPYGQGLLGIARGSASYFPSATTYTTTSSSFVWKAGGGVDFDLSHRFGVRIVQAQFMRTRFPNGSSNEQNHLDLTSGVVVHFGHFYGTVR
jgi:hypothetical protein